MKRIIKTDQAPAAIGPYNQAIVVDGTVYVSGQIAIDPETGQCETLNIETETHQMLQNVQAVLEAAGSSLANVLSCTIYVTNMDHYSAVNMIYSQYFPQEQAPARALVEVSRLPKNMNIEISVIAKVV